MKKRLSFLSLFGVAALLVAMVGAITALAAPSSANVTGSIRFVDDATADTPKDVDWYNVGSTATIMITDADVNVTTEGLVTLASQAWEAGETLPFNLVTLDVLSAGEEIVGTPKVLQVGQACPDGVVDTNLKVNVFDASAGTIFIQAFIDTTANNRPLCFNKGQKDTVTITVTSTQDAIGLVDIIATETEVDSGIYTVDIILDTVTFTDTPFKLKTTHLDTLTIKYKDTTPTSGTSVTVSDTATVETAKPGFSALLPAQDFSTQSGQPTFSGTITDTGGSGIDVSTILLNIDGNSFTPTVTGSDGDSTVTYIFTPASDDALSEGAHLWFTQANDLSTNLGRSDATPDDLTGCTAEVPRDDDAGCEKPLTIGDQDHDLSVDTTTPDLLSAETGRFWDTSVDPAVEKGNKLDRLVVIFDGNMGADTMDASDFVVEGVTPLSAQMFTKADQTKVYLTLSSDLKADDKPVVKIAAGGSVSDKAGNSLINDTVTAQDKIAPTLTVALDTTLTKSEVVVTISSNERISGVPTVEVTNEDTSAIKTLTVVVKTSTSWEATFKSADSFEIENSVVVTVRDLEQNERIVGDATKFTAEAGKVFVFTQDTNKPTVTFKAADVDIDVTDAKVDEGAPFITATFNEKVVSIETAEFGEKGTTLVDVSGQGQLSDDGLTWVYAASGLVKDLTYSVNLSFTDKAGNSTVDQTASFKVTEKLLTKIALKPGMNLISLPGDPVNPAINSVITVAEVSLVITFDPADPLGPWLVSTRDVEGNLSGSLISIDASHAYWVQTTSFAPIEVDIPGQATGIAALPAIPVIEGYNLLPVVSLKGSPPGTKINADTYFGSTEWVVAYTYDTAATAWVPLRPGRFDEVEVGKGYWVYVSKAGTLAPVE